MSTMGSLRWVRCSMTGSSIGILSSPCRTVPEVLSTPFYQQAEAWLSPFMPCGVKCLDDFFRTVSGKALQGGSIVVVQTHGRHGQDNPPLPIMATSGGGDAQAHQGVH